MIKMKKQQRRKGVYLIAVFVVLCSALGFSLNTAVAGEPEHKIVVLKSEYQAISPDPLKVKQGATIIWVNEGKEPCSIIFKTKIGIACKAPVNFYADLFGHYETGQILHGATASLCFIDKGKYEYEVKRMIGKEMPVEKILPAAVIVE
jgi:plastocyanin